MAVAKAVGVEEGTKGVCILGSLIYSDLKYLRRIHWSSSVLTSVMVRKLYLVCRCMNDLLYFRVYISNRHMQFLFVCEK